jgi:CxxC motif-containing protein
LKRVLSNFKTAGDGANCPLLPQEGDINFVLEDLKMKEFTCIVCPNGCSLHYDEVTHTCTGNRARGRQIRRNEVTNPMRSHHLERQNDAQGVSRDLRENQSRDPKGMIPDVMKESIKSPSKTIFPSIHRHQKRLKHRRGHHHDHPDGQRKKPYEQTVQRLRAEMVLWQSPANSPIVPSSSGATPIS